MDKKRFEDIKQMISDIEEWNDSIERLELSRKHIELDRTVCLALGATPGSRRIFDNHIGITDVTLAYIKACIDIYKGKVNDLQKQLEKETKPAFGKWVCQKCGNQLRIVEALEKHYNVADDGSFFVENVDEVYDGETMVYCPSCGAEHNYSVDWAVHNYDRSWLMDEDGLTAAEVKKNA